MKIDKNNMDEFFKNRLNNFDGADGDWDLPSERPWEQASQNFPKHPRKSQFSKKNLALIFLGLALATASGFIFFQQKNITELKLNFKTAEAEISKSKNAFTTIEKELSDLKIDFSEKTSRLISEKEASASENTFLQKKNKKILTNFSAKAVEIESLKTEMDKLQNQIEKYKTEQSTLLAAIAEKDDLIAKLSKKSINPLASIATLSTPILNSSIKEIPEITQPKIAKIKRKKRKKQHELGIYGSQSEYQIPVAYNFSEFNPAGENDIVQILKTGDLGLNFGYELKRNLFLRTGLRLSFGGIERDFSSALYYDKSGEFINTAGVNSNAWLLETNSSLGTSKNRLTFEIPQGIDIPDGDLVIANLKNVQVLGILKIPVGVDYYIGKKRLQWWLRGGIALNLAISGDVIVSGKINHKNQEIPVEDENIEPLVVPGFASAFFSGYAGIGFNYRFARRWHFRGNFSEEVILAPTSSLQAASLFNLDNESIEFGFHYRF